MRKIKFLIACSLSVLLLASSCKRDGAIDIDIDKYPIDTYKATELDKWIQANLTDPFNIQVVYRFDRNLTDPSRNVSPANISSVRPMMQLMMTTFMDPYINVGGLPFAKEYFPKQWVLFGSHSYNTDGSIILGTMSNARTMTLYGANVIDTTNGSSMERLMRTVHHEFTHSINQRIPIPPAFESVTPADYDPNWVSKSEAAQRDLGFISPYASSSYTEDFAEMLAHIVALGPVWYNNFLSAASATGRAKIQAKEAILREYMLNNFGVDVTALQTQVRKQLKDFYHVTDPADITLSFPFQLFLGKVNTITYNPTAAHYTTYGSSAAFTTMLNNYSAHMQTGGWFMDRLEFIFTSSTAMSYRVYFRQGATGTTVYAAEWNFTYTVNTSTGIVKFVKVVPESSTLNTNRNLTGMMSGFETFMLPYLTNRQFVAAYLPTTLPSTNPLYRTFAGFSVDGTSTNYFYGPVTYR